MNETTMPQRSQRLRPSFVLMVRILSLIEVSRANIHISNADILAALDACKALLAARETQSPPDTYDLGVIGLPKLADLLGLSDSEARQ